MLITILLTACSGDKDSTNTTNPPTFGDDFLWGTAIAGFQVEAGCPSIDPAICEDRNSDWYQWVTDPELIAEGGTYLSGEPMSNAPGHYELYEEDFALAAALGNNALRTSLEWSRLFPNPAAETATTVEELAAYADPTAVAYYHAMLTALRAAGLRPLVTLDHYTLPIWLHDGKACHADLTTCEDRGWVDLDRIKPAIALYSAFCAQEFGAEIDDWATLNEPLAIVLAGYLLPSADRTNPPGVSAPEIALDVFYNLIEGHAVMYDAVKAYDTVDADGDGATSSVGLVINLAAIAPVDPTSSLDAEGVANANYVYNLAFLNGAIRGEFDRDFDGVIEEQRDDVAGRMDYVGINYYTRITVRGLTIPLIGDYEKMKFFPEVLWEEYPEGMREVVELAAPYGLPILITENGTTPTDTSGETFLRPHLQALLDAKEAGADVRGYFYWSLIDNYEWNHGTSLRFGLYEVDPTTKARSLRSIGETYASIIEANAP